MQYIIAKDMEQRSEAFERLTEAANAARTEGMDQLAATAEQAMDMLDAL
jgi:hypothetical protein